MSDAITLLLALEARDQASKIIEGIAAKVAGFSASVKAAAAQSTRSGAEIEAANVRAAASTASYERAVAGQAAAQKGLAQSMAVSQKAVEAQIVADKALADAEKALGAVVGQRTTETVAAYEAQKKAAQAAALGITEAARAEEAALIQLAQAEKLAATRAGEMAAAQKTAAAETGLGAAALKGVTIAAGATALAVGFIGEKSIKAAGDFETATNLLVVSAGESRANIEMVREGMLHMAGQVGATGEQLAHAMLLVERGGQHGADGLKVLQAAAEGAKAENSDLAVVADAVTSILVDYHMKADDAATVTSKLVAATAAGKTTFEEMSKSMAAIMPVASAAHVSLDDILGDLSAMTIHGMSAQQSAQNLADVIRHMQSPTAIQAKELALLGMTTADLADGLKSKGLSGTLQEISDRIVKLAPPGTDKVILNLKTALNGLSPAVRELGMHLFDGSMSAKEYTKAAMALDPISAKQAVSFGTLAGSMHRIGDVQMTGAEAMQTYGQALNKATGDATGLNVALMLSGENAGVVNGAVKSVSAATAEAGNHVLGWKDIQETFNFKMQSFKGTLDSVKIAIGTGLLPVVSALATKVLGIVKPVAEWTVNHQHLSAIILGSLGGISALVLLIVGAVKAFEMVAVAIEAVKVSMVALKLATMEAGAAFALTPLGWVVIALMLVVGAVYLAWTHFAGFRKVVIEAWDGIKKAAEWAWNNALKPAFEGIKTAIMDGVVPAALWLWHNALEPAFKGIGAVAKWLWETVLKPVFAAWWAYAQVMADICLWLWNNAVEPAFKGIAAVAVWLWNNVLKPVFDGWVIIFKNVIAPVMMWLWHNVISPVWEGIKVAIDIAWTVIKTIFEVLVSFVKNVIAPIFYWLWKNILEPVWQGIQLAISVAWAIIEVIWGVIQINLKILGFAFSWLYDNIIKPSWDAIGTVISWVWRNIIKPLWEELKREIHVLADVFQWLWHYAIEPVWHGISDVISFVWYNVIKPVFMFFAGIIKDYVHPAFKAGIDAVGSAWHGLQDLAKIPVKFVVNTVLNDGLLAAYNKIANIFGVKPDNVHIPLPAGFNAGGPVWGAGTETSDSIPALLSTNEHVLTAAEVRRAGGHGVIMAWRRSLMGGGAELPAYPGDGSSGLPGFAKGGIVGAIDNLGKGLWDLFTDPRKALSGAIDSLIGSIPGGGRMRDVLVGGAHKLGDGLINWIKGAGGKGDAGKASAFLHAQVGKPYIWASAGPDGFDCSGIVSAIYNVLKGTNPYSHTFSTMDQARYFPKPGYGLLTAGWTNPGEAGPGGNSVGHTAGVLAGLPFESVGGSGVRIGGSVTPLSSFAHVGTFDRGGPIYPGWNAVLNKTGGMEYVQDPQGGGAAPTVYIDLRESKFMSDRDIDILLDKIDKRLVRVALPGAGVQVRR